MSDKPSVLFACIHNSGRSVAAKVLTEHHGGDRVTVHSAGSEPDVGINPVVAGALEDRGLSVAGERPTQLDLSLVEAADVVVTMGCGEECPYVPGKRYVDWEVEDPKGKDTETVARIVDDIEARVLALLQELA